MCSFGRVVRLCCLFVLAVRLFVGGLCVGFNVRLIVSCCFVLVTCLCALIGCFSICGFDGFVCFFVFVCARVRD